MKPLIVLISVYVISLLVTRFIQGNAAMALSGRIAMAAMLLFTAIGHVLYTNGMTMMLPDFIPYKKEVIYLTGVIELAAAIGLLIPQLNGMAGWLLIVFFILILPANIYAAIKHIDYQKASFDGYGLMYLWFRVPLQLLFIIWTYFSAVKSQPA